MATTRRGGMTTHVLYCLKARFYFVLSASIFASISSNTQTYTHHHHQGEKIKAARLTFAAPLKRQTDASPKKWQLIVPGYLIDYHRDWIGGELCQWRCFWWLLIFARLGSDIPLRRRWYLKWWGYYLLPCHSLVRCAYMLFGPFACLISFNSSTSLLSILCYCRSDCWSLLDARSVSSQKDRKAGGGESEVTSRVTWQRVGTMGDGLE